MAKGKGKPAYGSRKASAADLTAFDDASTTSSVAYGAGDDMDDAEDLDNVYEQSLDLLLEKRGATRVQALEQLVAYLKADVRSDESSRNCLTMIRCCLASLRKGSARERELAALTMGLHIISLPDTSESLFEEMQSELERAAMEGPGEVRSAAIETLSLVCYIVTEDEDITTGVMDRLQQLWTRGEAAPRAAALRGWTLLFTSLSCILSSNEVEGILQRMADLISDKSVDVRSAAGGVVAVLCGSYKFLQPGSGGNASTGGSLCEEDSSDCGDEDSQVSSSDVANMDGLMVRMRDLATHNRHDTLRTSKRDKAALRTTFRSILETVEEGAVKAERFKLKHSDILTVDTLSGKVALDSFKRLLGSGLQAHLQANPLLHSIFGFSPSSEAPARLSYLEKRHYRSPSSVASKGKTAERKHDRAFKSSRQARLMEDEF